MTSQFDQLLKNAGLGEQQAVLLMKPDLQIVHCTGGCYKYAPQVTQAVGRHLPEIAKLIPATRQQWQQWLPDITSGTRQLGWLQLHIGDQPKLLAFCWQQLPAADSTDSLLLLEIVEDASARFLAWYEAPVATLFFDAGGTPITCNDAARQLLKIADHECQHFQEQFFNRHRQLWNASMQRCIEQGRYHCQLPLMMAGKPEVYADVTMLPIKAHEETIGVACLLLPITAPAEHADPIMQQLQPMIQQAVIATQLDGTIVYWNNFAEKLYGWSAAEALGANVMTLMVEQSNPTEAQEIMTQLNAGKSWAGQFKIRTKHGKELQCFVHDSPLIDPNGQLIGIIGTSWDITHQKETQEYIQFQARLLNMVEQAIIATSMDGEVVYSNEFANTLFGFGRNIVGENLANLQLMERSKLDDMWAKAYHGQPWIGELPLQKANHDSFPAFVVLAPLLHEQEGHQTGMTLLCFDISQLKAEQTALELEKLNTAALINNTTTDLMWSVDPSYRLIAANDAFLHTLRELYGMPVAPGIQLLTGGIFPEAFIQEWQTIYDRGLKGEIFSHTLYTPATSTIPENWSEISVRPIIQNQRVIGVACHGRNITESVQANRALERANKRLETAQQLAKLGYWERNLLTGELYWTDEVYAIFEFKRDEQLQYEHFMRVVHPEDRPLLEAGQQDMLKHAKALHLEYRIVLPDGRIKYLLEIGNRLDSADGTPLCLEGTVQDVTSRRQSEIAIRKSEHRFRTIFNDAPVGMALVNSNTGQVFDMNDTYCEILGRSREEIADIHWRDITHPDDLEADQQLLTQLNAGQIDSYKLNKRYLRPDGNMVWVQLHLSLLEQEGTETQHLCIIEDITERIDAERKLKDSNERYNLVAEATHNAIWDWDLQTNQVLRSGQGLERLAGYDSNEASTNPDFWRQHVYPDDLPGVLERRNDVFGDPTARYWEDEYRFTKADGSIAFLNDRGYIIRNAAGDAVRMIGATEDITQRKQAELLLRELNQTLAKRAQELERSNLDLEQFAYVASHDLQEPLRMVTSFLQLLQRRYEGQLDAKADQYIHFAVEGANRMKRLILDLLEYSRLGANNEQFGETDMEAVMAELEKTFAYRIATLQAQITADKLPVLSRARYTLILQLLQNLLANALKYRSEAPPIIHIGCRDDGKYWTFWVKDNGIGFDQKYAEKIFTIFQRLHARTDFPGTGIGLAICKKIIDLHEGRIWAESTPQQGSTFYFSLPK